jgi:hypothetical protein
VRTRELTFVSESVQPVSCCHCTPVSYLGLNGLHVLVGPQPRVALLSAVINAIKTCLLVTTTVPLVATRGHSVHSVCRSRSRNKALYTVVAVRMSAGVEVAHLLRCQAGNTLPRQGFPAFALRSVLYRPPASGLPICVSCAPPMPRFAGPR